MVFESNTALKIADENTLASADIMSLPQACTFLGIHRNTLYKLIQEGEIPAFRMTRGGRWKFRRSELIQWLEDKQSKARL